MASAVTTSSAPFGKPSTAASSVRPSAPGCRASGLKWRAISRSSADTLARARLATAYPAAELAGAKLPRQLIEHRIDHAGLLAIDEGMGDIDIFGDHDAGRHVGLAVELVGAGAQDRAQHGLDALERPAFLQGLVDHRIELALVFDHAADHVAKMRGLRRQIFLALDLAADPVALELRQRLVDRRRRQIHLVERLHRSQPGGAAAIGLASVLRWCGAAPCYFLARWRLVAISDSTARAASPPLSCSVMRARAQACASLSVVRMPLPQGKRCATE